MPLGNWINPGPQQQRSTQDNEINNYGLVGSKGWMTYCKLLVGTLLATWNFNLFINTIAGRMGIFTAFVAISLEVTALYCVHNYPRSIGNHQKWLGRFAVLLGLFSLAHAVFAIVHYTGYAGNSSFVVFYSHVIALPLIVILLSVTTATLVMTHPSAAIIKELAASKIQSLKNRAQVLMERNRLLDAQELARLKAQLFEEETAMKVELIPILRRRIEANQELEGIIDAIDDIDYRRRIRDDIAALTSRLPATLAASSPPPPATTTTQSQVSPHARQTVLGLGQGYAVNGGSQNGHP
jgi:hypothetical protein